MARTKWRLSNELCRDALVGKTGKVKRRRSICVRLVWFCGWKNIAGCKRRGLMSLDGCLVSL